MKWTNILRNPKAKFTQEEAENLTIPSICKKRNLYCQVFLSQNQTLPCV